MSTTDADATSSQVEPITDAEINSAVDRLGHWQLFPAGEVPGAGNEIGFAVNCTRDSADAGIESGWVTLRRCRCSGKTRIFWQPDCESSIADFDGAILLASSRLPKSLGDVPQLFDAFRTIASQLAHGERPLLTGSGITCEAYVGRLSELFDVPLIVVAASPLKPSPKWVGEKISERVHTSNRLSNRQTVYWLADDEADVRRLDEPLIGGAGEVLLLSVRAGGNVCNAAKTRLRKSRACTRLLLSPALTRPKVQDELLKLGAIGWYLISEESDRSKESGIDTSAEILDQKQFDSANFLIHCTRQRTGPWPEQTEKEFLDDLIFGTDAKSHRPIDALYRILASNRLYGSNQLTRDPREVVCFADVRLEAIAGLRKFRSHLGRWDFEPFGIAIDRNWLQQIGGQPVIYGDDAVWDATSEPERPWFQAAGKEKTDWSVEREWRIVGDLNLRDVPTDAAVVFVPTQSAAQFIAPICRWPIVVLGED